MISTPEQVAVAASHDPFVRVIAGFKHDAEAAGTDALEIRVAGIKMQQRHIAIIFFIAAEHDGEMQVAAADDPVFQFHQPDGRIFKGGIAHAPMVTCIGPDLKGLMDAVGETLRQI